MSDYRMDIGGNISLSDYSAIDDYMGVICENDNLTIVIEGSNNGNFKVIENILERNKIVVRDMKEKKDGKCYISAHKKM